MTFSIFSEHLIQLRQRIAEAEKRAARAKGSVKLLGASKYVPIDILQHAWNAGLHTFGENQAQELKKKAPLLPHECEWHFIGNLQTNKVRDVVQHAEWIHSIDRLDLARVIDRKAGEMGKRQKILIEVNMSGEMTKHGVTPADTIKLLREVLVLPHVHVGGLMTIAPFCPNAEQTRPFFAGLRQHKEALEQKLGIILPELSMGMSHDFEIAIEEGATMVRIGTALFGPRNL